MQSKKSALCIKCLENLKYKEMAQLYPKMQFYETRTTSRKHNLQKKSKKYNLKCKKSALCIQCLENLKYKNSSKLFAKM